MTQNKQSKGKSRLGHWARVAVIFLSGGFIFPHGMTEDDDIAKHVPDKDAVVKKQWPFAEPASPAPESSYSFALGYISSW